MLERKLVVEINSLSQRMFSSVLLTFNNGPQVVQILEKWQ